MKGVATPTPPPSRSAPEYYYNCVCGVLYVCPSVSVVSSCLCPPVSVLILVAQFKSADQLLELQNVPPSLVCVCGYVLSE